MSANKKAGKKPRKRNAAAPSIIWLAVFAAFLLAAGFFARNLDTVSDFATGVEAPESIHICEVMTSNKSAVMDDGGNYPDWVELVNDSQNDVNVAGWKLVDRQDRLLGLTFPEMTIKRGERVLVYCSGDLRATVGYPLHAPFKLSAQGDDVTLLDTDGNTVDSVTVPAMGANEAYVKNEDTGVWSVSLNYTPGEANTPSNHQLYTSNAGSSSGEVVINEVMADNATYARSKNGGYYDYIELYNAGKSPVSLDGYTMTDDEGKPGKWSFGNRTIAPGEYMLMYASGLADDTDGEIHLNFRVSSKGETIRLYNAGTLVDSVTVAPSGCDAGFSRMADGTFTSAFPPTPKYANDQSGINAASAELDAQNPIGVVINEAIASARKPNAKDSVFDWIELYNSSAQTCDLSGYHLTDDTAKAGAWTFPQGSSIKPGEYMVVFASGEDRSNPAKGNYHTNFKLSLGDNETIGFFAPDGTLVDRLPMMGQAASVSFGRPASRDGLYFLDTPTRGAANISDYFEGKASKVEFGSEGGYFTSGEVTVSMKNGDGQTIRYTLDCSEPDENSTEYTLPFQVSSTTIVRARAFGKNLIPSNVYTQSYIFGEGHSLPVVSLVSQDDYLFGSEIGIYSVGPKQLKYPFKGANFFKNWERAGNVELFSDGRTVVSQGVGLQLQGQYSRMQKQKAFKVVARNTYGDSSTFSASLFADRDYSSYKSFILRASGQDSEYTRIRDAALTSLSKGLGVMYQDNRPVVVYINGEYWGHYNMRERVHKYSIAQWEGWSDVDAIDIVKGNSSVLQGSNDDYASFLNWLGKNGCKTDENLARVEQTVDVENYLKYVAIEMYIGNTDLLNVKRYRSGEGDGKWRWVLYDTDWAFNVDTDSFRRWLDKDGAGSGKKTDNTLFVQLMKNNAVRDRFLTILADVMYNYYRPELVVARINEYCEAIESEIPRQSAKWGGSAKIWNAKVKQLKSYAQSRPKKLLGYIKSDLGWSNQQMREYFADIMDAVGL